MKALNNLGEWTGFNGYQPNSNAKRFMTNSPMDSATNGSACGAGDPGKTKENPPVGGSACGAADPAKIEEKPSACGSACGAADPSKTEEKPPAGGSACGAADPDKK